MHYNFSLWVTDPTSPNPVGGDGEEDSQAPQFILDFQNLKIGEVNTTVEWIDTRENCNPEVYSMSSYTMENIRMSTSPNNLTPRDVFRNSTAESIVIPTAQILNVYFQLSSFEMCHGLNNPVFYVLNTTSKGNSSVVKNHA